MRNFLLLVLLLLTNNCKAQTKTETEDWISFYLDKYFNTTESFQEEAKDLGYQIRNSYSFYFDKKKLICVSSWYKRKVTIYRIDSAQTLYQQRTYSYDLSKIKKVTYRVFNDTTIIVGGKTIPVPFSCAIYIDFNIDDMATPSVTTFNNLEKEDETQGYTASCTLIKGSDKSVLSDSILPRLVKALEHIATLNGSKVLKDVF